MNATIEKLQSSTTNTSEPPVSKEAELHEFCKGQLIFFMKLYPRMNRGIINHVMMPLRKDVWDPALEDLIKEGVITVTGIRQKSPKGQTRIYDIFMLTDQSQVLEIDPSNVFQPN